MLQLLGAVIGLLADLIVYWALPVVGAALFSSVAAVIIAVNPLVGAAMILVVTALLVYYCLKEQAVWQAVMWGAIMAPYGVLAIIAPHWSVLWGLGINILALGVIAIPGAILPHARGILAAAIFAAAGLHTVLAFTVWSRGVVFLILMGFLAMAMGSLLFSQGARPYEIRRTQRVAGRMAILTGVVLIVLGLIAPRLSKISIPEIPAPRPVVSVWKTVSTHTEMWALRAQRSLIGERAKTHSLEKLEPDLQRAHRERWKRGIQRIPDAPLTPGEWSESGVEQDP